MNKFILTFSKSPIFRLITVFLMIALPFVSLAQDVVITDGSVITCDGVFIDDGGTGGLPYTPGNDYTFTICPDNPGDVIQVSFVAFALYTSPNPNNSDRLFIFDGDDATATGLGSYTGNSLQGLPVTGTINNTSGCLTFVFDSNPNGPGTFPGWEANISCTTPCATPTAASEIVNPVPQGIEQSIGVCLNAPVTFGDIGSFAEPTFNLQYWVWNFDDGTIDTLTTPSNVTHNFTEPGEYLVTLSVVDNNGCRSLNIDPLQVLVSTIPIFNTDFQSPVCVGDGGTTIDGNPIQSVTWTALPPQVVAGETYLADGAGFSYTSTLTFDFFEPGMTLENCADFLNIFVNIEHSYLGDLQMSVTCPDGTNVILVEFPNGGGGTFLGEAVDDASQIPGIGYNYAWAPGQTNGNLSDATTIPTGGTPPLSVGNSVPPGTYESDYDLCDLVGCPLNGDWTFNVLDNLGADNGYIFAWGINFNPILFPDITTFTPIVGLGPDSTWWEGPNINNTTSDGNTIQTSYTTPGNYDYTFYATNNFGCTFDTTITVEVIVGPDITGGPDLTYCNDPVTLEAGLANSAASCGQDAGTYEVCYEDNQFYEFTYCPDNPGDGVTFMEIVINSGTTEFWDTFTVYDGDNTSAPIIDAVTGDLSGLSFIATNATGCLTITIDPDGSVSCGSGSYDPINYTVSCGGGSGLIWAWSPAIGLSDPNIQNPTAEVSQAITYTVSAYPVGFPGCIITDQVTVSPDALANPGIDTDSTLCYNSPISFLTDYLDGDPALNGVWTDPGNNVVDNQLNPTDYTDGATFSYTYTVTNGACEGISQLDLTILPATDNSCCQTNAMAGPDATPCDLTYQLTADNALGLGTWTAAADVEFSDIHDPHAIATCTTPGGGTRTLTWTDNNGFLCVASDQVVVNFADPIEMIVVTENADCFDQCSGGAIGIADGGTVTGGAYVYDWYEKGSPGLVPQTRDSLCAGIYQVKIFDNLGCTDSTTFEIGQPQVQEILLTQTPPLCKDSCDGQVQVISQGAVEYSFDGGLTYGSENIGQLCAGEHTIIAKNAKGCEVTKPISLVDPPKYKADFNVNPLPTTTKNTLITFQDVSRPGPVVKSHYTFGDDPVLGIGESRISSFIFPKDTSGVYPVTLISTNMNGCVDTLLKRVVIKDDLLWFIPNSFTPNEDGINDVWKPLGYTLDATNYKLTIFDRWGEQVFTTTDIKQGWNGSKNGDSYYVSAGIYTYLIKVTSETTEEKHELTGFITVVR